MILAGSFDKKAPTLHMYGFTGTLNVVYVRAAPYAI